MSKDTMISLSKIVSLLMVDTKWAELQLHPDNINRDSGMEIPEAWMPTIKKTQQRERYATADRRGKKDETARIKMHQWELLKNN